MTQNDTDSTIDEQITDLQTGFPIGSLGEAHVRIGIDEETYQRVHEEYLQAVEQGYTDGFDTFVFNHCSTGFSVTVDGEPVDPDGEGNTNAE